MPELNEDLACFIATSWQAMGRVIHGAEETKAVDLTVMMVFAAFYVEGNISGIVREMGQHDVMEEKIGKRAGFEKKLSWFFSKFVEDITSKKWPQRMDKLNDRFPGIREVIGFRNDVSHGSLDRSKLNLDSAKRLRQNAKNTVKELINIAEQSGTRIEQVTTYRDFLEGLEAENIEG